MTCFLWEKMTSGVHVLRDVMGKSFYAFNGWHCNYIPIRKSSGRMSPRASISSQSMSSSLLFGSLSANEALPFLFERSSPRNGTGCTVRPPQVSRSMIRMRRFFSCIESRSIVAWPAIEALHVYIGNHPRGIFGWPDEKIAILDCSTSFL
jgi:hypothetical protein